MWLTGASLGWVGLWLALRPRHWIEVELVTTVGFFTWPILLPVIVFWRPFLWLRRTNLARAIWGLFDRIVARLASFIP